MATVGAVRPHTEGPKRADPWSERSGLDTIAAIVLPVLVFLISKMWPAVDILASWSADDRARFYGMLITPCTFLLTLSGVALGVYSGASGPVVQVIRDAAGDRLLRQLKGAVVAPGVGILVFLFAYVLESTYTIAYPRWVVLGVLVLLICRISRVLYFYLGLLTTADRDRRTPRPTPGLND